MKNSVDLEELKEKYGSELHEALVDDIQYALESDQEWKLNVIEEGNIFIKFASTMKNSVAVYEVNKIRKTIRERYLLVRSECQKLLSLMDSLNQAD